MIDYEEIRKEIAIAHNVLLDKDDSALVMVTLNDLMFRHYSEHLAQQVAEQNEAHRKAIETALQKSIADAKLTAGRVITDGGDYVGDRVRTAMKEPLNEVLTQIKKELAAARLEMQSVKKIVLAAAAVSCICTIATVSVAITVI